jgi:tRNA dimethylallyltransferase
MTSAAKALVIGGPTASGKSALALAVAGRLPSVIINGDSLQLYQGLPLLSAQPTPDEQALCPHLLYNFVSPKTTLSVHQWLLWVKDAIKGALHAQKLPIIVGGSGLYLSSLIHGLAHIPDIPEAIRTETRSLFAEKGARHFHALLADIDPLAAADIHPNHSQRAMRAFEVMMTTGKSIITWQRDEPRVKILPDVLFYDLRLLPPRDVLYQKCDLRIEKMIADGAVDEVSALLKQGITPDDPIGKTIGFPELNAYLTGQMTLDESAELWRIHTRQYAKRQYTWFKHQGRADLILDQPDPEIIFKSFNL